MTIFMVPLVVLEDASIHFGSEILVRTIGPFKQSYLYDDLSPNDPILNEAIYSSYPPNQKLTSVKNLQVHF